MATTLNLFRLLPKLHKPGAPLLLFQQGGQQDNIEILQTAIKYGWICQSALTWNKLQNPHPARYDDPVGASSERILCFVHGDHILRRPMNFPNGDIISMPGKTRSAYSKYKSGESPLGYHHLFEHPPLLAVELISRFVTIDSRATAFEPFGCTGFASVAATWLGLNYIYCESHKENFSRGVERIKRAKEGGQLLTAERLLSLPQEQTAKGMRAILTDVCKSRGIPI